MSDGNLKQWLKDLQNEFVICMTALDEEARRAELGFDDEGDDADDSGVPLDDAQRGNRRESVGTNHIDRELEQHLQEQALQSSDGAERIAEPQMSDESN